VLVASITITLMMEAASTSETSVNLYQTTWRNNQKTAIFNKNLFLCKITVMLNCLALPWNKSLCGKISVLRPSAIIS
jgi:hypothetical protein